MFSLQSNVKLQFQRLMGIIGCSLLLGWNMHFLSSTRQCLKINTSVFCFYFQKAAKVKGQSILLHWLKDIVNHFWWCCKTADTKDQFLVSRIVIVLIVAASSHYIYIYISFLHRHFGLAFVTMSATSTHGKWEAANTAIWEKGLGSSGSREIPSLTKHWWTSFSISVGWRMSTNICISGKACKRVTLCKNCVHTPQMCVTDFFSIQPDQQQTWSHFRTMFWCMSASALLSLPRFMRQEFCRQLLITISTATDQQVLRLRANKCKFNICSLVK